MDKGVFIYGSGGHARVIADILATAAGAEPKLRKIVLGILAHEAGEAP